MGKNMAQKKKKAPAGARAAIKSAARAPAPPQINAPVAATNTIECAAASSGAARADGAARMALGSSLSIREVGERAAQFKALIAAGSAEVDAGKLES